MTSGTSYKEILTSDIGLALYLLANDCTLMGIKYETGRSRKHRFNMKFGGVNPEKFCKEYYSKKEVNIEFKKYLPQLFEAIITKRPEIWEYPYVNSKSYKSKGYGD